MTQLDLLSFDSRKLARRTDPATSKDAAARARFVRSRHHELILAAMQRAGRPMAAEEVADAIGLDMVAVCRRFSEMVAAGLIERTNEVHVNRSRRNAFKHRLSA